jgi:uncharacterized Zn finger protein
MPEPGTLSAAAVRSHCPDCQGQLRLMRVIEGRRAEYWTMRCTKCGGIHLDIVKDGSAAPAA